MRFKLIIVLAEDDKTDAIVDAARKRGATGATVITSARGEGLEPATSFLGLSLESSRDVIFFLVEEHLSRSIIEYIAEVGEFDKRPGSGIAFQIAVEDAVGVHRQMASLYDQVEEKI